MIRIWGQLTNSNQSKTRLGAPSIRSMEPISPAFTLTQRPRPLAVTGWTQAERRYDPCHNFPRGLSGQPIRVQCPAAFLNFHRIRTLCDEAPQKNEAMVARVRSKPRNIWACQAFGVERWCCNMDSQARWICHIYIYVCMYWKSHLRFHCHIHKGG